MAFATMAPDESEFSCSTCGTIQVVTCDEITSTVRIWFRCLNCGATIKSPPTAPEVDFAAPTFQKPISIRLKDLD